MAHFAKIENNTVVQVVVVPDDQESNGASYLESTGLIGEWVQTSYNAKIRGRFAGIGDAYDREKDIFISKYDQEENSTDNGSSK